MFVLAPLPLGSLDLAWICFWNFLLVCSLLTADLSAVSRRNAMLLIPLAVAIAAVGVIVALQTWSDPSSESAAVWELPRHFSASYCLTVSRSPRAERGWRSDRSCCCRSPSRAPSFSQATREPHARCYAYWHGRVACMHCTEFWRS
ncbi:hypothetical protein ACQ5SK_30970 [Bradyrhizobium japonicum]